MKKICMVVNNPFTNDSRVLREARTLTGQGFDLVIYATKRINTPTDEFIKGIRVKRPVSGYDTRLKLWRFFTQVLPAAKLLEEERADIYHAHDLDTLYPTFLAAKKNKSKLVYDSHELFTESHIKTGPPIYSSLKYYVYKKFLSTIESNIAPKADEVITVNESIAKELRERYGLKRVTVIMNAQVKNEIKYDPSKLRKLLNIGPKKKIILYQGYMTSNRGLDKLLASIEYIEGNFIMVLIGDGEAKGQLENQVLKSSIREKVKFLPLADPSEIGDYTSGADVGVIPYQNVCLNNYYSTPNKLFEYVAYGLAVVASDFPQLRKKIIGGKFGLVFDEKDPRDIAAKISSIITNKKKLEQMKRMAKKSFEKVCNWEIEEKKLLSLYEGLVQ